MKEIDEKGIREILNNHRPEPIEIKNHYAVLITLIRRNGKLHIVYEERSHRLKHQPAEISFPGGRIEEGEKPSYAAMRETSEELLIPINKIKLLGEFDYLINSGVAIIYCFVGKIEEIEFESISPSEDEVHEIFSVPLEYFFENSPRCYEMKIKLDQNGNFPYELIPGGRDYKFRRGNERIFFYEYNDKVIWGLTAKLTYYFTKMLLENRDVIGEM